MTNTADGPTRSTLWSPSFPVPDRAGELLDLTGRWCRERSPAAAAVRRRHPRCGRAGAAAPGTTRPCCSSPARPGSASRSGEVWARAHGLERQPRALRRAAARGPGEQPCSAAASCCCPARSAGAGGDATRRPWSSSAATATGLDGARRAGSTAACAPGRSIPARPRPVMLNTWEAVYFDHDLDRLLDLAERAAARRRRAVRAGRRLVRRAARRPRRASATGWSSTDVWPRRAAPARRPGHASSGMEFGLWFEPEMVNPDSDARPRPPRLGDARRRAGCRSSRAASRCSTSRNPEAYDHLLERHLGAARRVRHRLHQVGPQPGPASRPWARTDGGRPGVHAQTLAFYRLLDELRARHPGLEIESCSSGGARVDLGVLSAPTGSGRPTATTRSSGSTSSAGPGCWCRPSSSARTSGPPVAHTTHRADVARRCARSPRCSAHAGLELGRHDVHGRGARSADAPGPRSTGRCAACCTPATSCAPTCPTPGALLHGVVAADRREALYAYVRLDTSAEQQTGRLVLPGLDPDASVRGGARAEAGAASAVEKSPTPWWERGGRPRDRSGARPGRPARPAARPRAGRRPARARAADPARRRTRGSSGAGTSGAGPPASSAAGRARRDRRCTSSAGPGARGRR